MKPERIILIRHGESIGNADRRVYGEIPDYKLTLTEKGKEQALDCGVRLKKITNEASCCFYVSPLWRTRETYQGIKESFDEDDIVYREEPRIREQEWGHLRNLEESNKILKERDEFGTFYFRIPDGESAADVYDRVSDFFGTLHRDFHKKGFPENCIIVSHGMTIRLFLMKWFHWTVEEFETLRNPHNCAIIVLQKNGDGKYELKTELERR
jgi:broad specificity phosphatase PhoE